MENQVITRTKNRRHREAMKLQQRIAAEWAEAQKGRTFRVLADQARLGRTEYDAPDVDCRVVLTKSVPVGSFVDVKVTGSQVYDLVAKPL
jgi:ribosomal protein S12 methylthiotransferase